MGSSAHNRGERLDAVDLLRVCSALLVLAFHYGATFARGGSDNSAGWAGIDTLPRDWAAYSWFGWVGVEVFFVISGLVIAGSARGVGAGTFLARRARRLVPAAWLCATITALVLLGMGAGPAHLLTQWAGSMVFSPVGPWIDASYWTLGIEISFYLLVAGAVRLTGSARLEGLAWLLALASLGYYAVVLATGMAPRVADRRWLDLLLLPHGALFGLGIFVRAILTTGLRPARAAGVLLCVLLGLIEILGTAASVTTEFGIGTGQAAPAIVFLAAVAILLAAPWLQAPLGRMLPHRQVTLLGLATYPLYLLHQDAGGALFVLLQRAGLAPVPAIALTVLAVVAGALLVAGAIEPALRRRLVRAAQAGRSAFARVRTAPIFLGEHAKR